MKCTIVHRNILGCPAKENFRKNLQFSQIFAKFSQFYLRTECEKIIDIKNAKTFGLKI